MNGKGSARRPSVISADEYTQNYNRTFATQVPRWVQAIKMSDATPIPPQTSSTSSGIIDDNLPR